MNVTIENLAPCKRLVRVELDAQKVDAAFSNASIAVTKAVKVPGFRPGKAPKDLVHKQFSKDIVEETRRQLVNEAWPAAVEKEKLEVLNRSEFELEELSKGKPFAFKASVEVAPEFEIPSYKGLAAKREKREVGDADVDRAIRVLREQQQKFEDVNRASAPGDILVVNYTATSEGKPLTEFAPTARGLTEQKSFWMEIKEGSFIPGFTEQLVGASKGDKRSVDIEFPQDFVAQALSGRKAVYEVEITEVKERILPELDVKFAEFFGAKTVDELLTGIRRDLAIELGNKQRREVREQLLKAFSDKAQFDVPESLVIYETRKAVYDIAQENMRRGIPKEKIDEQRDQIFAHASGTAKEKVKLQFMLQRIAREEKIEVTRDELSMRIVQMAENGNVTPESLVKDLSKNDGFRNLAGQIILEKAVQVLEDNAAIEDIEPAPPEVKA